MLKKKNYLVIIDDAHKVIKGGSGIRNMKEVRKSFDYVILLSSQGPLDSYFKELTD